jgi:hypothetical protein
MRTLLIRSAVIGCVVLGSGNASAQNFRDTTSCRTDLGAAWLRAQKEWYEQDAKRDWSDDSLRATLLKAVSIPDSITPIAEGAELLQGIEKPLFSKEPADLDVHELLKKMAAQRQWPTRSVVGARGVHAALLSAKGDSALAMSALHRMMEAGPGEALPADVAVLEDRMRLAAGRKQLYATHFILSKNDSLMVAPAEDIAHVDLRRAAAGLPPLQHAACRVARQAAHIRAMKKGR